MFFDKQNSEFIRVKIYCTNPAKTWNWRS